MGKRPLVNVPAHTIKAPILEKPEVGNVIMCEAFQNGTSNIGKNWFYAGLFNKFPEYKDVGLIRVTSLPRDDGDRNDESRSEARFVIKAVHTFWTGGNWYPRSYFVIARRLGDEWKFDPNGELILIQLGGPKGSNSVDGAPKGQRCITSSDPIYKLGTKTRKVSFD